MCVHFYRHADVQPYEACNLSFKRQNNNSADRVSPRIERERPKNMRRKVFMNECMNQINQSINERMNVGYKLINEIKLTKGEENQFSTAIMYSADYQSINQPVKVSHKQLIDEKTKSTILINQATVKHWVPCIGIVLYGDVLYCYRSSVEHTRST